MPPKKASAPPTTFEQLIEKVRATFVDDVALKTKLGQLGNFSEEYHKELLAADTARFKDLDLFTGLTKKVPQTPATVERKGTKAADLKPDKPYGPEASPPPKPPPKKRETKKSCPKKSFTQTLRRGSEAQRRSPRSSHRRDKSVGEETVSVGR